LWQPIVCVVILIVISVFVIISRKHYLIMGWLWYLGTLVPVIGLFQSGLQAMADRYTYLPSIGIYIMIVWSAAELTDKWRYRKIVLGLTSGIVLVVLLACTRMQVRYWQNNLALFGHTAAVTENNYVMHNEYGAALHKNGQLDEAIIQYKESLRIAPQYSGALNNMGVVYLLKGKAEQAIACWKEALKYKPDDVEIMNNMAWVKATRESLNFHDSNEAIQLSKRACDLTKYSRADILDTLAAAYASAGDFDEAIKTATKAIGLINSGVKDNEKEKLVLEIQGRLRLYKAGQPYREK
jgi:tetratricopeptide (TPR) repeat protein